jgi:transposase
MEHQHKSDGCRKFFVDETGSTNAMARDHARAPRGQRVTEHVPRNCGDVIKVIGALMAEGLTALMTIRGATTKEVFRAYTKNVLAPQLRQGDAVVWDNLAAHKDPEVRKLVEEKGAKLSYLPPYTPDLNPIELAWSWTKWWLKTCRARSEYAINAALKIAQKLFTIEMAIGCIRRCGFDAQPI